MVARAGLALLSHEGAARLLGGREHGVALGERGVERDLGGGAHRVADRPEVPEHAGEALAVQGRRRGRTLAERSLDLGSHLAGVGHGPAARGRRRRGAVTRGEEEEAREGVDALAQPRHQVGDADPLREAELVLEDELARETVAAEVDRRRLRAAGEVDQVVDLAEVGEVDGLAERRERLEHAEGLLLEAEGDLVVGGRDRRGDRERGARDLEPGRPGGDGVADEVELGVLDGEAPVLGHEQLPRKRERRVGAEARGDPQGQPRGAAVDLGEAPLDHGAGVGGEERGCQPRADLSGDVAQLGELGGALRPADEHGPAHQPA